MATIYDEMLASLLAEHLERELVEIDEHAGLDSFLGAASHALNKQDYDLLVEQARKKAKQLRKQANGCPSKVFGWRAHYSGDKS